MNHLPICDFCGAPKATAQCLPDLRYPQSAYENNVFSPWGHPLTGNVCRECAVKQMQIASGGALVLASDIRIKDALIRKAMQLMQDFVDKCDRGEARSERTYASCKKWLEESYSDAIGNEKENA